MGRRTETTETLKNAVADAFIELLKVKPFDKINVQEIIELAKVGRVTYFRYFDSKEDMLIYRLGGLWQDWADTHPFPFESEMYEQALWFFTFCGHYRELFSLLIKQDRYNVILVFFKKCLDIPVSADSKDRYQRIYAAHGMFGIISDWLERGCIEDEKKLARLCTKG